MLHILHGENEFEMRAALKRVIANLALPGDVQGLNTETLTGPISAGDLRRACSVVPFLSTVRIVIVEDGLARLRDEEAAAVAGYLEAVPESTCLIFVESKPLPAGNAVLKAAVKQKASVQRFDLPNARRELPLWVQRQAVSLGGKIEPAAAHLLAANIGVNLRLLDQELQKLLLYCGDRSLITVADVNVMVPYIESADVIFNLVDALGQGDARNAALYLHRLLQVGEHPLGILGMIVRQYRLLIQVQWLKDHGSSENEIISRLKLHPYVAQKVSTQASRFLPTQLRAAYRLLRDTDVAIKQGDMDA